MRKFPGQPHDVFHLESSERTLPPSDHGDTIELRSVLRRQPPVARSWYLASRVGSIHWPTLNGDESLKACEETLAAHGWVKSGPLPPECFEYRKAHYASEAEIQAALDFGKTAEQHLGN